MPPRSPLDGAAVPVSAPYAAPATAPVPSCATIAAMRVLPLAPGAHILGPAQRPGHLRYAIVIDGGRVLLEDDMPEFALCDRTLAYSETWGARFGELVAEHLATCPECLARAGRVRRGPLTLE